MRVMSIREFNQNISRVVADAERGEPTVITKNGVAVAKLVPHASDARYDPERRAAFEALERSLVAKAATGIRVGKITEADRYGD